MGVNEHGGVVRAWGKDGKSGAGMGVDEYGGSFRVFGNSGKEQVGIGVNEYGNGAVSTWDKNGYRLGSLGK